MRESIKKAIRNYWPLRYLYYLLVFVLAGAKVTSMALGSLFFGGKFAEFCLKLPKGLGLSHPLGFSLGIIFFIATGIINSMTRWGNMLDEMTRWIASPEEKLAMNGGKEGSGELESESEPSLLNIGINTTWRGKCLKVFAEITAFVYSLFSASSGYLAAFSLGETIRGIAYFINNSIDKDLNSAEKKGFTILGSFLFTATLLSYYSFNIHKVRQNLRDLIRGGTRKPNTTEIIPFNNWDYAIPITTSLFSATLSAYYTPNTLERMNTYSGTGFSSADIVVLTILGMLSNGIVLFGQNVSGIQRMRTGEGRLAMATDITHVPEYKKCNLMPITKGASVVDGAICSGMGGFLGAVHFPASITSNPKYDFPSLYETNRAAAIVLLIFGITVGGFSAYLLYSFNEEGRRFRIETLAKRNIYARHLVETKSLSSTAETQLTLIPHTNGVTQENPRDVNGYAPVPQLARTGNPALDDELNAVLGNSPAPNTRQTLAPNMIRALEILEKMPLTNGHASSSDNSDRQPPVTETRNGNHLLSKLSFLSNGSTHRAEQSVPVTDTANLALSSVSLSR